MAASKGSKPDKIIRDALILELNRETDDDDGKKIKKVSRVVAKLVSAAMNGEVPAIKEIFDRVEGKPAQAVTIGGDEDNPIHTQTKIDASGLSVDQLRALASIKV